LIYTVIPLEMEHEKETNSFQSLILPNGKPLWQLPLVLEHATANVVFNAALVLAAEDEEVPVVTPVRIP